MRIVDNHNLTLRFGINPKHPGSPAFAQKASFNTTLQLWAVGATGAILFSKVGPLPYIMDPLRILGDIAADNAHLNQIDIIMRQNNYLLTMRDLPGLLGIVRDWPFGTGDLTTVFTNFFNARVGNPDLRLQDFLRLVIDEMYAIQHIGGNPTITTILHVVMERIRAPLPSTILPSNLTGSSILPSVQRRARELFFGNSASAREFFNRYPTQVPNYRQNVPLEQYVRRGPGFDPVV